MSYCSASCTSVRSPLIAAIATFALKADVWFRRGLLLMLSPDSRANLARCQAEAPLIALCRFPKPALKIGWDRRQGPLSEHDLKALPVVVRVPGTNIAAPPASTPGPLVGRAATNSIRRYR